MPTVLVDPTFELVSFSTQFEVSIMPISGAVFVGTSASVAHPSPAPRLVVKLLGRLEVTRDGSILDTRALGGVKPRQILKILLLQSGSPVSKNKLLHLLWGDKPPAAAITTLESYVCILRRNLQPGSGQHGVLRTSTGGHERGFFCHPSRRGAAYEPWRCSGRAFSESKALTSSVGRLVDASQ